MTNNHNHNHSNGNHDHTPNIKFRTAIRIRPFLRTESEHEEEELILRHSSEKRTVTLVSPHQTSSASTPNNPHDAAAAAAAAVGNKSSSGHHSFQSIRQKWQTMGGGKLPNKKSSVSFNLSNNESVDFHYDTIMDDSMDQLNVYNAIAGGFVRKVMEPCLRIGKGSDNDVDACSPPRHQLVLSFGVSNSGKTFTLIGGKRVSRKPSAEYDGIVPRILDDLFRTFEKNAEINATNNEMQFLVQLSMMEVRNDKVYDLLTIQHKHDDSSEGGNSATSSSSQTVPVRLLGINHDAESDTYFVPDLSSANCASFADARKTLAYGLQNAKIRSTSMHKSSSRGHILFIIQPVVLFGEEDFCFGGQITILDMAGVERGKKGDGLREIASKNSCITTVMKCLCAIKSNDNVESTINNVSQTSVTYGESKLTMLLQPVLSGTIGRADVTLLVSAYSGKQDYQEKKFLLEEIQSLRGTKSSNADPCRSSHRKRKGALSPTKLIRNSPLRHIPKAINSIQDGKISNLTKLSRKHENPSLDKVKLSAEWNELDTENRRLKEENEILQARNNKLEQDNRRLHERISEIEKKARRRIEKDNACSNQEAGVFKGSGEWHKHERETRQKKLQLIQSPLQRHVEDVMKANQINGDIVKSRHDPFQLTVPKKWGARFNREKSVDESALHNKENDIGS